MDKKIENYEMDKKNNIYLWCASKQNALFYFFGF